MAEIKIEKKKPVWPWILAALVVIIALFFIFSNDDNSTDRNDSEMIVSDTANNNQNRDWEEENASRGQEIDEYLTYINNDTKMGIDHDYTNNAIIHLIDAVSEKADQLNIDINADLDKARKQARYITDDPMATDHAGSIKQAGTTLTNALQNMQQAQFPNLNNEVRDVETAVNQINPEVLTLDQKDDVKEFFDESADLLKKMDNNNNNI